MTIKPDTKYFTPNIFYTFKQLAISLLTILLLTSPLISNQAIKQAHAGDKWWEKALKSIKKEDPEKLASQLDMSEISTAFKEALRIGSENVVGNLSAVDGFNGDPAIHIPLPRELKSVKKLLKKVGMSELTDDLELKLNRAAEAATPKAKALFLQSISEMTFEDVKSIYEGSEDSATRYFQEKMTLPLSKEMNSIVKDSLSEVGAIQAFDTVMDKYKSLPFVPDIKANLTEHVVKKGMDGIFYYLAKEEAAIRKDPVKQTTDLLKKVFGGK